MRKKEFLKRLNRGLVDCSRSERRDIVNYYDELIEDTMDSTGKSESKVIADLGKIEDICRKANPHYDDRIKYEEDRPKRSSKRSGGAIGMILFICLIPIWLALGIVLLSVIVSIVCTSLGLLVGGVFLAYSGVIIFTSSITYALFRLGIGILFVGVIILLAPILIKLTIGLSKLFKRLITWLFLGRRRRSYEN